MGDLQGQDAGEHVDADVVLGPVVHGRERHDVGSFSWRKENSASDWDRYPAMTSGTGQSSWLVITTRLPKISSSSPARAPGSLLHARRRSPARPHSAPVEAT